MSGPQEETLMSPTVPGYTAAHDMTIHSKRFTLPMAPTPCGLSPKGGQGRPRIQVLAWEVSTATLRSHMAVDDGVTMIMTMVVVSGIGFAMMTWRSMCANARPTSPSVDQSDSWNSGAADSSTAISSGGSLMMMILPQVRPVARPVAQVATDGNPTPMRTGRSVPVG